MITRNNAILHLIDIQERLFDVMWNKDFVRENMVRLVKGLQILDVPILWMEQYPKGLGQTIPELRTELTGLNPMEKSCFSSCDQGEFLPALNATQRKKVIVSGVEAHVCVYQTVIGLMARGYEVEVVADAISSRTERNYDMALRIMENEGAKLTTVEMLLFELLQESGSDEFKQISRLIK